MAESTSKLRAQVAALTNVDGKGGFDIMQDEDTFKSIYDIMLGISKVWDEMTDVKQSALLELLAGKVRSNQVAALLNNMSRAEEILQTSENSAGTMEEVHARWLDSIAAKQAQLAASWENLSQTMMSSDVIKFFYDSGSNILNTIDGLIKGVGSLTPALTAVSTGVFGMMGKGNALTGVKSFGQMLGFGGSKDTVRGDFINAYNSVYNDTLDKQQALGAAVQAVGGHMNDAERFAVQYSKAQIGVGNGATIASMKLSALGGVLKTIGSNLAVMAVMAAVSAGVNALVDAWDKAANAEQYAVQAADDATAEYKEAQSQVQSLEQELENVQKQYDELAAKGPLNFADEQTKADLKAQTEELKLQLEIAKELEKVKAAESYRSNKNAWAAKYNQNGTVAGFLTNAWNGFVNEEYATADALLQSTADETFGNELRRIEKYVNAGQHNNDIQGSLKLIDYLGGKIEEYRDKIDNIGDDYPGRDNLVQYYQGYIDRMTESTQNLRGQMLKAYDELNSVLSTMRKAGDETSQEYKQYKGLRDIIGEAIVPNLFQQQKLIELREKDSFNKTYKELAKLAETTEITADTLNDAKYNDFRNELKANGIEINNLIALLNELRKAGEQTIDISTTSASDIKDRVTNLLGYRDTGASIFKNTGYGTKGISDDDYQKLVDMNDIDYLKAVENSHGTMWFNQAKFNEILTKKIAKQNANMYDDMKRKQSEYVKETKKLNELLSKYQQARTQGMEKEAVALQNQIAAQTKNMNTIQQEIALYNRLSAQIKASSTAYSKWQLAHNGPEESDDYDQALEAYKVLQKGAKSGRIGTADYQTAQKYLLGEDADYYGSKEQRKLLKRYMTRTKDNVAGWGARNFQKDLQDKGVLDSEYRLTKDWSAKEIASMMGIGSDLVEHLFGEMNTFIADESKKYKLKAPTLEEEARGPDYAEYLKASKAFSDAVAAYNQNAGEQELKNLQKARADYLSLLGSGNIDEQQWTYEQLQMSNTELQSATEQNTSALTALTSVIAGLGLDGYSAIWNSGKFFLTKDGQNVKDENGNDVSGTYADILSYVAKLAEQQGSTITDASKAIVGINELLELNGSKNRLKHNGEDFELVDENGIMIAKFDNFISAIAAAFDDMFKKSSALTQDLNKIALQNGIGKQMYYNPKNPDGKRWEVQDLAGNLIAAFDTSEQASAELFSDWVDQQRNNTEAIAGFVKALKNGELKFDLGAGVMLDKDGNPMVDNEGNPISIAQGFTNAIETSMSDSGATFGQKAIDAWNADLKSSGIKELIGINKDGKFTFGEEQYGTVTELLGAVTKKLTEANGENTWLAAENMINATLDAVGDTSRRAKYNPETGGYKVGDEDYATAAQAMSAIAGKQVQSLADAFQSFNSYMAEAKSSLQATYENGQAILTDTANGQTQKFDSLATLAGTAMEHAYTGLQSVANGINEINARYSSSTAGVQETLDNLKRVLDNGAKDAAAGLKAINEVLSAEGIKDALGINEEGKFTFAGEVFESIEEALAAAFKDITASPDSAKRVLNNILEKIGQAGEFAFENGKYVQYDADGNIVDKFDTVEAAIAAMTGGSLSELAGLVQSLNAAYKSAGETVAATVEQGKLVLTNTKNGMRQEYELIDTQLASIAQSAYESLTTVLNGIQQITVKVEADGKFSLVGSDGKPLTDESGNPIEVGDFNKLINLTLGEPLSKMDTLLDSINKWVNPTGNPNGPGFGLGPQGQFLTFKDGQTLVNSTLSKALEGVTENISAKAIAEAMKQVIGGSFELLPDGGYKYNGVTFDTFAEMIKKSWNPEKLNEQISSVISEGSQAFSDAASEDAGAFKKNQSAVESATSALGAFSAALAASSLNQMLAHTGQGGNFVAGPDNTIQYYDEMGILRGIFSDMESAYGTKFGNFGEWAIKEVNGALQAVKEYKGKDGKYGGYTEDVGSITSATVGKDGRLILNQRYAMPTEGFAVNNGQLTIDANGTNIALGNVGKAVPQVDKNNVPFTQFFDAKGNQLLSTYGRYAYDAESGGVIERPDTTGLMAGDHILQGDVGKIIQLIDYIHAAGESADEEARALEAKARELIDQDETGQYYDLFGDAARKYGFTKTAKDEADAAAAREMARREAEAKARAAEVQAELDRKRDETVKRLNDQMKERRANRAIEQLSGADINLLDQLYDLDKLVGEKRLDKYGNELDREDYAQLADYLFNMNGVESERYRKTGVSVEQAKADREAENKAAYDKTKGEITAWWNNTTGFVTGKAAEVGAVMQETINGFGAEIDKLKSDAQTWIDGAKGEVSEALAKAQKAADEIWNSDWVNKRKDEAQSAAETLEPVANTVTGALTDAGNAVGQFAGITLNAADAVVDFFTKPVEQKTELQRAQEADNANGDFKGLLAYYNSRNGLVNGKNGQTFQELFDQLNTMYNLSALYPSNEQLPFTQNGKQDQIIRMMWALARFQGLSDQDKAGLALPKFESMPGPKSYYSPLELRIPPTQPVIPNTVLTTDPNHVQANTADKDAVEEIDEAIVRHAKQLVGDAEAGKLNGNVDVMNRPVIPTERLIEAGYNEEPGGKATLYSSSYTYDDKILHVTPILPNGEPLSQEELDDYVDKLVSSGNPVEADKTGYKLVIWDQDTNGNIEEAIKLANEFDNQLHLQQEKLYADAPFTEVVDNASEELSETPVEVDVKANTDAASSEMDTNLGHKSYTATVTVNYVDPGLGSGNYAEAYATGTSNATGGTSLVDEAGAELIEHVNRGTYELGTDNGPRFTKLDKGDVVHTAEETKKIKRRGFLSRISNAFRNGVARVGGAFAKGRDDVDTVTMAQPATMRELVIVDGSGAKMSSGVNLNSGKSKKKSASAKIKDALKWAEKFVDWIPTALDILKKKTTDFIKAAEKSVGYLAQNKELTNAIANVREEIDLNNQAVERYKKQANDFAKRAGLSSNIVKLIQEGEIDIKQYDENTRKAIQTYQTWWDKAKGCLDTIESLNDQMYDLAKQKLDNIVTHFGNIDDQLNEQIKTFNSLIEVKEAYGQEMTRDDYLDAIRLTGDVISNLEAEQTALTDEFERQVNSGVIKVGSDDWYNYAKQIEELNSTLSEAKVDMSNLNDEVKNISLNNLKTSIYYLDNLQTKIEGLQKLREAQGGSAEINSYRELISTGMEQIKNLEEQNSELRKQMEGLDVLSEKYQEINKQLQDNDDQIMDIKANQEQWNDAILDMKIEVLQKQNEKYQQQINLMKALNDLEDARQRRVLLYDNEAGFHYVMDEKALEDAQDTVNDQIYDMIINGLEAQKENNNIYDNMGNQLIPVTDMLSGIDFSQYYDSINRGSENSSFLTNALKSIDMAKLLEGTVGGDVKIDIGDIVLNGVNDAKELGNAIIAQLPGYLVQALYAKGS